MNAPQMHHIDQASIAKIIPAAPRVTRFIVLGRDEGGKAHASWFDEYDRPAAERAAALMGMHGLIVDDDGLAAIAQRLPRGKLFASGRAFVPFVKGSTFDQLAARLPLCAVTRPVRAAAVSVEGDADGTPVRATAAASASGAKGNSAKGDGGAGDAGGGSGNGGGDGAGASRPAPRDWGSLAAGDTVLALDTPDEGWWEANVVEVREGELVLLRWRDFPGTPTFSRRRTAIALLHPDRDRA